MQYGKIVVSALLLCTLLLCGCQPVMPVEPSATETQAEILVQGAPLRWPEGLSVDAEGRLVVADFLNRSILRLDPDTGEILSRLGPDQGVDVPEMVAVGADDSIYWTAWNNNDLCRLQADGTKQCQTFDAGVSAIGFSEDGRLFAGVNDALYEVDPELASPPVHVTTIGGFIAPFDFGPDGMLYIPLRDIEQIVRVDVDATKPSPETVASSDLPWAFAASFDAEDQLHCVVSYDEYTDALVRVDTTTGEVHEAWRSPAGLGQPILTEDGRLFVGDIHNGAIREFLPDGSLRTVSPSGMVAPGGLAVRQRPDGGESVFVADLLTVREFDGVTGEEIDAFHLNPQSTSIVPVQTVAIVGENLILTSPFMSAVQFFDPQTRASVDMWMDQFDGVVNAMPFQDKIIAAELGSGRVVGVDPADPAELEVLAAGLEAPAGLAVTDDDVWVSDYAAGTVYQIVADGATLTPMVTVISDLLQPEGIALAPDGRLLVVETGADRLIAVDLSTGQFDTIAEGLGFTNENPENTLANAYWIFSDVAVGPSGNAYVSADANNVIYRIPLGS